MTCRLIFSPAAPELRTLYADFLAQAAGDLNAAADALLATPVPRQPLPPPSVPQQEARTAAPPPPRARAAAQAAAAAAQVPAAAAATTSKHRAGSAAAAAPGPPLSGWQQAKQPPPPPPPLSQQQVGPGECVFLAARGCPSGRSFPAAFVWISGRRCRWLESIAEHGHRREYRGRHQL